MPEFVIESGGIDFDKPVVFWKAHFTGALWLRKISFQSASFDGAVFEHGGDFSESNFGPTSFRSAKFGASGRFDGTTFNRGVTFEGTDFREVSFMNCSFYGETSFFGVRFMNARFGGASFDGFVHFGDTLFAEKAYFRAAVFDSGSFSRAVFKGDANFGDARFGRWFNFGGTRFQSWTNFEDARFEGQVRFGPEDGARTRFGKLVTFDRATFNGLTVFEETDFLGPAVFVDAEVQGRLVFQDFRIGDVGALDFRYVTVRGERVEFLGHRELLDMARVRLLQTDTMRLNFRNVQWRKSHGPGMAFDEVVLDEVRRVSGASGSDSMLLNSLAMDLEGQSSERDSVVGGTTVESVEGPYRGLRRNYEESLRYPEAGDFYVREMEMKRIGRALPPGLGNWFRRNLSLLSLYWILSKYGESYNRALAWIGGSVIFFTLLRLAAPLSVSPVESLAASAGALFQITGETSLDHVQRLWSILILALFFLAVRRRLKR